MLCSYAIQAIRHASVRPPHLVQSGWTMSTRVLLEKRPEALPARQHLAGRDRHRRVAAQLDEALEVVRRQRLLEPDDVVVRRASSPSRSAHL